MNGTIDIKIKARIDKQKEKDCLRKYIIEEIESKNKLTDVNYVVVFLNGEVYDSESFNSTIVLNVGIKINNYIMCKSKADLDKFVENLKEDSHYLVLEVKDGRIILE